jgi:SAM-dependent methyltransferase
MRPNAINGEQEVGRVSRVWGTRCVPLVYDPFLLVGELRGMRRLRGQVVGQARGRVLELGAGTGLNMKHYKSVDRVMFTEPDPRMVKRLKRRLERGSTPGGVVMAGAEQLPFEDGSFDTVVATLVFCTVPDPEAGFREIRRVLAPGGRLLFIEHVRADSGSRLERWQNRLFRPWRAFAAGCRCNQPTVELLRSAGLHTTEMATARWRGMSPVVRPPVYGEARPGRGASS